MAGLGATVAELLARARDAAGAAARLDPDLRSVSGFGPNPGALAMWLHAPEGLAPGAPLVVVMHGCGQTAAGYAAGAGWIELADRYGFAVLCPEQVRGNNPNLCFNWFEDADIRRGSGEAASIAQMVGWAVADLDLDPRRVFVTGLSAGGAMAAVMLATYPDVFAAGAVIAGLPYRAASAVGQALAAMRSVPQLSAKAWGDKVRAAASPSGPWPTISIWHGDADGTVTPAAAQALALQWCDVHGAVTPAAAPVVTGRDTRTAWLRPDGAVAVELHLIAGLGHGAPIDSRSPDGCGAPAPWILEAGVSSSRQIAQSWGIVGLSGTAGRPVRQPASRGEAARPKPPVTTDVGETIARALRGAGLMR